jgi:hypothetical protein
MSTSVPCTHVMLGAARETYLQGIAQRAGLETRRQFARRGDRQ